MYNHNEKLINFFDVGLPYVEQYVRCDTEDGEYTGIVLQLRLTYNPQQEGERDQHKHTNQKTDLSRRQNLK